MPGHATLGDSVGSESIVVALDRTFSEGPSGDRFATQAIPIPPVTAPTTGTAITLSPSSLGVFSRSTATITVTDLDAADGLSPPSGSVTLTSSDATDGVWSCVLSATAAAAASCATSIIPINLGNRTLTARYFGDATHSASHGIAALTATSQTPTQVTQTPTSSPTSGQPDVHPITVTASGFPAGAIDAAAVAVLLTPSSLAGPPTVTRATRVVSAGGTTRRVTFTIPTALAVMAPTSYQVTFGGTTATGNAFHTQNAATLFVNPAAAIVSLNPVSGLPGEQLTITLDAEYTNFVQGSTQVSFGPGISVGGGTPGSFGPVTVVSSTRAQANVVIDSGALGGPRMVAVRTGIQQAAALGFSVQSTASLVSVNPNVGQPGQSSLAVTIVG
jgi:hypothetical protein